MGKGRIANSLRLTHKSGQFAAATRFMVVLFVLAASLGGCGSTSNVCQEQVLFLNDSLQTAINRLGQPSRSETVPEDGSEREPTFVEWLSPERAVLIIVNKQSQLVTSVLVTEGSNTCSTWDGVAIGRTSLSQLVAKLGSNWDRRHIACDEDFVRLTLTYQRRTSSVEYTVYVPNDSIRNLVGGLCADDDDLPTELLEERVEQLYRVSQPLTVRSIAIRKKALP